MRVAVIVVLVVLVATACAASVSPLLKKSFCGQSSNGVLNMQFSFSDETTLSFKMTDFGQRYASCVAEPYSFDTRSGIVTLPSIGNSTDCMFSAFVMVGVDTFTLTYRLSQNSLWFSMGGSGTTLAAC
jgi:hypothetical protein